MTPPTLVQAVKLDCQPGGEKTKSESQSPAGLPERDTNSENENRPKFKQYYQDGRTPKNDHSTNQAPCQSSIEPIAAIDQCDS